MCQVIMCFRLCQVRFCVRMFQVRICFHIIQVGIAFRMFQVSYIPSTKPVGIDKKTRNAEHINNQLQYIRTFFPVSGRKL